VDLLEHRGYIAEGEPGVEPPESEDIARLLAEAKSGDPIGFDRLFRCTARWRRQLVRFYLSWLPDEPDTLEELVAMTLFQAVLTYDDCRGSFVAWYRFLLRRAVYRAHLEWRRRHAILVTFSELGSESIDGEDRQHDVVPDSVYLDEGIREWVRLSHLVDRLHAMARVVLDRQLLQIYELCFRMGLPHQEVARRLGISRHAVARQVMQVRKALIPLIRHGL
jgi:RNA polymerase sigma factor (sigma-70 family)